MFVKDVMTEEVIQVPEKTPLNEALSKMIQYRSSCLVVESDGRPIGIITERDATREFAEILNHGQVIHLSVNDVMTPNPLCVDLNHGYEDALILSRSRKLRHLPVIDDDHKIVGLVTQDHLVGAYVTLAEKQNELQNDLEALKALSLEDPLMHIGNRRAMEVDLSFTEAESIRHGKTYSVALMDIDHFKKYNDHYGHQEGDEALRKVSQLLKDCARDSDRIFRYGGEEILILMPETDASDVLTAADRYRKAIEDAAIPHEVVERRILTVSAGVASSGKGAWQDLVKRADDALYDAKAKGRNRVASANA